MEYFLVLSCIAVVYGGVLAVSPGTKHIQTPIQSYDLTDLESYNCNSVIESGTCATGCSLSPCYRTSSLTGSTFPQDGFCAVFNVSQPLSVGVNWYTVSGRICLSSSSYPQGTGLLFNYQDQNNYEVVYKTSQDSSTCYVGYVQNGVTRQTASFECGTTTADQWHRYTVTVYSDKTFEASLSTQAGNSTTSGRFATNYRLSTRGGTLMTNNGSPGKVLNFDEITMDLTSIDDCASSPCGYDGSCVDGANSYTCECYLGYTGARCETALSAVVYFLEWSYTAGFLNNLTSDGIQTRVSPSGSDYEQGLEIDIKLKLLFYTTSGAPGSVWRAELHDVIGTQTRIWDTPLNTIDLALCTVDRVVFVDQFSQNATGTAMITYEGALMDTLNVSKDRSFGMAVDETQRILYFTEGSTDKLWKVSFSPTGFIGYVAVILQGTEAGDYPTGLVFEADTLYWILYNTGEIRSMPVTGSTSTVLVPAAVGSGYETYFLSKKNEYFYYTRHVSDGGVYRVTVGGNRDKITTSTTLETTGIDVY